MRKAASKLQTSPEQETLFKNWERYRGSIVMVIDDKIFATKRAKNVHKMIKDIEKEYHRRPLITYIPKADTLIMFI